MTIKHSFPVFYRLPKPSCNNILQPSLLHGSGFNTLSQSGMANVKTKRKECFILSLNGPDHAKMCLMPYANNKGADQPAHPRSLISTIVVHFLDSIMPLVSISEISRL